ncbi:autophagy protein 12-like isoform X1 [Condylostylus longicornis]|uniref:autophagy protein 12-like isoform X1 n=1 Tax=Condylostylus longicornis TaxID=2530218 RepID=UPI00244E38BF|nr:autophagy protein 12-like isoform X1 [Condylostylus longicornis]
MADAESIQSNSANIGADETTGVQKNPTNGALPAKIDILLNATGNVPIMKKRRWAVDQEKPICWIQKFVHKYLKLDPEEKIFLYVNQTFAPSPDQLVKNLYECHGTNGKLVLYYCKNQAWG